MPTDVPASESASESAQPAPHPEDVRALEILSAGLAQTLPNDGLATALARARKQGRPLRVKFGIDPSGDELTLGHAVPLRKLRQFQDLGHTVVLIIGDFTGMVGDPTGRSATRKLLTAEQTEANASSYVEQVLRILSKDNLEIRRNSEWLAGMTMTDVLREAKELTVAQLLQRDDFAKRFSTQTPISLVEFLYPLLQGYDLYAIAADVEIGGTDQTYNLLVGRDIQRAHGQTEQTVLTLPLLEGLDGVNKMSKSLNNYVSVGEPAAEQFGKVMSIPDTTVERYATLAASAGPEELAHVRELLAAGGPKAGQAKRWVARRIAELYHGAAAGEEAEAAFNRAFREHQVPDDAPEHRLAEGDPVQLAVALVDAGLASSRRAARQFLESGAVRIDGEKVAEQEVPRARLVGHVVQVGKRSSARFVD